MKVARQVSHQLSRQPVVSFRFWFSSILLTGHSILRFSPPADGFEEDGHG